MGDFGQPESIVSPDGTTVIAVASTSVVYTQSFNIKDVTALGVELLGAKASGTLDIKVEVEVGMAPPSTEGSADSTWSEPSGFNDVANIVDTTIFNKVLDVASLAFPYMRFKYTGQGANPASATLTGKLFKR